MAGVLRQMRWLVESVLTFDDELQEDVAAFDDISPAEFANRMRELCDQLDPPESEAKSEPTH